MPCLALLAWTGRLHTLVIWPLAQREIEQADGSFLAMLAENPEELVGTHPASGTTRGEYVERRCEGGLPLAVGRSNSRNRWFDDYVQTSNRKGRSGGCPSPPTAGDDRSAEPACRPHSSGPKPHHCRRGHRAVRETVENHIRLLEDLYRVHSAPSWARLLPHSINGCAEDPCGGLGGRRQAAPDRTEETRLLGPDCADRVWAGNIRRRGAACPSVMDGRATHCWALAHQRRRRGRLCDRIRRRVAS